MELNKIKQRLELTLRPVEKPPSIEEVLEEVSTRGVLRGPVDWVFPAWMLYVEYAVQKIAETFPLSEEEKRQLLQFRETLKQVLLKTWMQTKEKVTILRKADGMYKIEDGRVYAPDGTWIYIGGNVPHLRIHGVTAEAYFPDVLKLPRERLELLQLGWRASDEGNKGGRPYMGTTQPWRVFAWTATRYGALRIDTNSVVLTREGASVTVRITARSWRQRWSKAEAVDLVAGHLRRGDWAPVLTMWLGDGDVARKELLHGNYKIVIATKEPWRLSNSISAGKAFVARGKEAFARVREAAGVYGELLDQLRAYKWIYIKLATDDGFRAAYKLKTRKRSIDVLKETYRHNNGEISTEQFSEADKPGAVAVAGVVMYLELVSGRAGSLTAKYYTRDLGKALAIAGRLESAGLRPNVVRSGPKYVVYIATADLLKLAERDGEIRKAIALYLAEKVKNGTPRQKEIAEKILKRNPFFTPPNCFLAEFGTAMRRIVATHTATPLRHRGQQNRLDLAHSLLPNRPLGNGVVAAVSPGPRRPHIRHGREATRRGEIRGSPLRPAGHSDRPKDSAKHGVLRLLHSGEPRPHGRTRRVDIRQLAPPRLPGDVRRHNHAGRRRRGDLRRNDHTREKTKKWA